MTTPAKIAADTARILLDTKSVNFRPDDPYTLASGLKSPSYIDCRRLISFPQERGRLMDNLVASIRASGVEFDNIAGGETAGIPFAALVAERMGLPMTYVRKKPKGYGRNARIEGVIEEGQNVLLLEDMTTDGGSKISFVEAIREAGATCTHTAVIFFYDIFPQSRPNLAKHGIELINMATWADVLSEAKKGDYFDAATLKEVEAFLSDPAGWSMAHEG